MARESGAVRPVSRGKAHSIGGQGPEGHPAIDKGELETSSGGGGSGGGAARVSRAGRFSPYSYFVAVVVLLFPSFLVTSVVLLEILRACCHLSRQCMSQPRDRIVSSFILAIVSYVPSFFVVHSREAEPMAIFSPTRRSYGILAHCTF